MDLEVRQALREVELVGKQHELFLALIDKLSDIELLTSASDLRFRLRELSAN